jgi:hydroxyacylglutathione hydrolase
MILERCYIEGLAHASYLFGSDGEAAVVDPKRDVDDYIATAERLNLRIVAVLETHPHADFVSGHVELAQRTGGRIFISHRARASYERVPVRDGDVIPVGSLKVVAMETPGHSPDSISYLVHENGIP